MATRAAAGNALDVRAWARHRGLVPWQFTDDIEVYAEHAWELLADRPAENTLALTVIENVRAGRRWSAEPLLFGWYGTGRTSGAISLTPPYELLLAAVPADTVDALVGALRARAVHVPGVHADTATTDRFAEAWTTGRRLRASTTMRLRLYALGALRPPAPPPAGRPRPATDADFGVATEWFTAFQREVESHPVSVEPVVRERIGNALLWLWEDSAGTVVALAGRNQAAAGVARVGPVYTPPAHRRRGYGAAVTAACTLDALRHDAANVVLFTDLANPTSNAIYQQIGYRPVRDHKVVRFLGVRSGWCAAPPR